MGDAEADEKGVPRAAAEATEGDGAEVAMLRGVRKQQAKMQLRKVS